MPPEPVSWSDVERIISDKYAALSELIAKEHRITSEKLEALRAEGRMREESNRSALLRTESNIRAYVDDVHKEIKQGVLDETECLQSGLDKLHAGIYGNGDMEHSIAYRVKASETAQADNEKTLKRWETIIVRVMLAFGVPLALFLGGALWMLITDKWELVMH